MERRCIWRYSLAAFDRSVLFVTMKKCEQELAGMIARWMNEQYIALAAIESQFLQ
jgi:hypothetical protein